jgi:D-methionine transport system substrate-binding protein
MEAGLTPKQDALAVGDPKGPYVNIIAIREAARNKLWVAKLVAAYHSPEVERFVERKFGGSVIIAW